MALKLSLKPGEKIAINGAVIVNGDRRSNFIIENQASVLRERDILQTGEADTPAKRIYLPVMLMALSPGEADKQLAEFQKRIQEFAGAVTNVEALETCLKVSGRVAARDYYKALAACRKLIEFEQERLADVA
jgi:flagellar protein FlbT